MVRRGATVKKSKRSGRKSLRKHKKRMLGGRDKITLHNWWASPSIEESYPFFSSLFSTCLDKFDKVNIYAHETPSNTNSKNNKILKVQYSGESYHSAPDRYDINIVPGDHHGDTFIDMPHMVYTMAMLKADPKKLTERRSLSTMPSKFCLFSVGNPVPQERIRFFHALSKYKQVDSCGRVLNNIEMCKGTYMSKEYHQAISNYKFMICFENKSVKSYLTEKLLIAYLYGAIPIYWGCPNVEDYIDTSSILYLKPDFTEEDMQALVKEVEALDGNDDLYRKKYESIFFKDGKVPDAFDTSILNKKICKAIESVKLQKGGSTPKYGVELIVDKEGEKERYEDLKPLIELFNITPTFVVGKDQVKTHSLYSKFDKKLSESEISLAINHIECIKKYKDKNEWVLIFESDVMPLYSLPVIKDDINKVLTEMQNKKMDFVFLGKGHIEHVDSSKLEKAGEHLYKWHENASRCTESYIISPNGIARYLEYVEKESDHASIDWDFNYFYRKNPDIVVAWRIPELFKQNSDKFKSTINRGI